MNRARRVAHRLLDILEAVENIRAVLHGETFETFSNDRVKRPAVERYFEIISEASRHIPDAVKSTQSAVLWRKVSGLGNILRHAYQNNQSGNLVGHIPESSLDAGRGNP